MTAPIPRDIPDLPAIPGAPLLQPSPVPASAVVAPVRRPLAAAFRLATALAAAAGVTLAILVSTPARALTYFSVQANIVLAAVMFLSAYRAWRPRRPLPSSVTGAALLYVLVAALSYHLLLSHTTPPFSMTDATAPPARWHAPWGTLQLLHTVVPAAALLDWLLLTPAPRLHLRHTSTWLLFPLAYLALYLTRGAVLPPAAPARYLYPFLDAGAHGYRGTLANALLLGLAVYGLAALLVALDHTRPNPVRRHL